MNLFHGRYSYGNVIIVESSLQKGVFYRNWSSILKPIIIIIKIINYYYQSTLIIIITIKNYYYN